MGAIATIALEVVYAIVVVRALGRPESPGIFGDMFGALNSLFAGLAFAGVVFTIYIQVTDSAEARRDQAAAVRAVEQQISLLQAELDLQRKRYRVEAGPFFTLQGASRHGGGLDLYLINSGAPVIVLDFICITPGCSLQPWAPATLPTGEKFHAPTTVGANPTVCTYRMRVRDRWGESREFQIKLDFTQFGGTRLDFAELAGPSDPYGKALVGVSRQT